MKIKIICIKIKKYRGPQERRWDCIRRFYMAHIVPFMAGSPLLFIWQIWWHLWFYRFSQNSDINLRLTYGRIITHKHVQFTWWKILPTLQHYTIALVNCSTMLVDRVHNSTTRFQRHLWQRPSSVFRGLTHVAFMKRGCCADYWDFEQDALGDLQRLLSYGLDLNLSQTCLTCPALCLHESEDGGGGRKEVEPTIENSSAPPGSSTCTVAQPV